MGGGGGGNKPKIPPKRVTGDERIQVCWIELTRHFRTWGEGGSGVRRGVDNFSSAAAQVVWGEEGRGQTPLEQTRGLCMALTTGDHIKHEKNEKRGIRKQEG